MGGKDAHQDAESFTKDINGGRQQQKTEDQGQSSNGALAAGKISKPGNLNQHNSFRGQGHGEAAGRKRGGRSKAIGITHKKSSIQIQKRVKKKRFRDEVKEIEEFVSDMRRQMGRAKRLVVEGKSTAQEFEALIARKEEENEMLIVIKLLADEIERYIFP